MNTASETVAESLEKTKRKRTATAVREEFAREYARLNDAQRAAVDTTEGPVMVVAGPGTGKTQVLALRVAKILQNSQLRPWNILCLTFSKSGATAMRKRLRTIIGPDAYGVTVNTIHGFCNDIITQHPSVFEDWSSMEQISDVERYRSLNKIIDQLMPGLQLVNPKSPYSRTRDILNRISQLKREGMTDKKRLLEIADEYEEVMSTKSREGTKAHAKNLLSAQKFRDLLEIFFRYQDMLQATGRYDYDDMILNVIAALKSEDWLKANVQERYQYILLDEFQDTNGSQYAFVEELTTDPTADNTPNLFVVGDDDQAIYRFQGANLTNILSFRERFPQAPVIALTTSYRCTQSILDAAESLISHNTERLEGRVEGLNKHLVSPKEEPGTPPRMLFSASDMSEPWMIADLVEDRLAEGVDPNDIAVIVQTNRELLPFNEVFKARNIPTILSGKLDLLSHPLVEQVIAILRAVHNPLDDSVLASAIASTCFDCHPADIAQLYTTRRERKCSMYDVLLSLEQQPLPLRNQAAVLAARDILLDLHHKNQQRTVVETLEHVYRDTGLLREIDPGTMDVVDFAAAQEFFDRIKSRAYEQPEFSFAAFLDDLEYYGNPDYGDLRLTYDLPHLTQSGVQLMTAHKSKGLEFATVIITNFREGHWDKRRNPPSISIPEDLLFGWQKDQKTYEQNQDERRVAFVAMTRAKQELLFTCPNELTSGDSTKAVSPSAFFAEAGELSEELVEVRHPEQMSTLLEVPVRDFDAEFESFLKKRLETFALSATALNHFLEDPRLFLEFDLLQRPQAKEPHFAYGNAIHHVLAKWADSVRVDGEIMSVEAMRLEVTKHLAEDELLTKKERERLTHLALETVDRYAAQALQPPYPIIHKVEYNVSAHLGDIPLKGKIDRIDLLEQNSSAARVIDFKTGSPKTPKQIEDYGYFRQLVFYDLLVRNGYKIIDPKEYVLEFVGEAEKEPVTRSYVISEEDRKALTEVIHSVWAKVLALDFTPL